MLLEKNQKLLMIGDSVTDMERARPVGEGLFEALGKSYVALVEALLTSTYPELNIRVVNMGVGGNTVRDLKNRWETDVFDQKPDWLSIMIGINDVWRQYDSPLQVEQHVYLPEYEETLDELVAKTLPTVKGLVLMTPYYMEPCKDDRMRATMDQYGAAVKRIAEKYGTYFIDTQAAFDWLFQYRHSASIAWDRVHPNMDGHMLIARKFLNTVGYEW